MEGQDFRKISNLSNDNESQFINYIYERSRKGNYDATFLITEDI